MQELKSLIERFDQTGWVFPVFLILGGFLLGLIIEKIVLARLKKLSKKSEWKIAGMVISSIRGVVTAMFTILGVDAAVGYIDLSTRMAEYFHNGLITATILLGTVLTARISSRIVEFITGRGEEAHSTTSILRTIIIIGVVVLGFLIILQALGLSITPMLTALGVGGLAVALALQSTLSNLFAGIHIVATKKVKPGDYVSLDTGEEGYVKDISWRNTTIETLENNNIIVPNSRLADTIITNYYQPLKELAVRLDVGVEYSSDLELVEKVTCEVARGVMNDVEGAIEDFEPFIRYHTFDDFSINFTVFMKGSEFRANRMIKHEFVKRLHKRYNEEDITIPFPIRTLEPRAESSMDRYYSPGENGEDKDK